MRDIVDVMDETSLEVFQNKKRGLALGDEAVMTQVGQGRDIMSILCSFYSFIYSFGHCNGVTNVAASSEGEHERQGRRKVTRF